MSASNSSDPNTTVLPSRVPVPTGNLVHDVWESVKHMTDIPCARGALMSGIASGAGIGFVRGLSAGPLVAGHWAMATFALISVGSWHICQKQIADERKRVTTIMESAPRKIKQPEESNQQPREDSADSTAKQ